MTTGRLQLPPIDAPVETPEVVRSRARGRVRLIGACLLSLLFATGARGVQLCLSPADRTLRAASIQRWDQVTVQPQRGEILDRHGRRLATSVATPNVVVDPFVIAPEEVPELAARVGRILSLDPAEIEEKMRRNSRYVRLAMRVHPATAAEIEALDHRGLWAERDARRYYAEGALASQVLGFVDAAGAGREGLEAMLDAQLRGGSLLLQRRRDRRGMSVDGPSVGGRELATGMDVHTTLDRTIQRITERALEGVRERSEPKSATAIVLDVKSGDILALANIPTFNPNAIADDAERRRNHAVQDAIEPGSVFKPFTVAAAMEEGLVDENTRIDCEGGAWFIGRTRIKDDHPHGTVTITEVIKYSSNIGSAKLALRVGAERFLEYVAAFGFGTRTGILLPGERSGVVRKADKIKPIELATTAFGQGVTATPLQLVVATATLANAGVRMEPRLVTRIEDHHGVPEYLHKPTVTARVVSEKTAAALGRMMITVTEPGGTATRARVDGYPVAGKTGTAEKVIDGHYSATARIGSFVGFVPADDPVLAVVVTVDEPTRGSRYGGIVAAPAFAEIAEHTLRYLGVPKREMPADQDQAASPAAPPAPAAALASAEPEEAPEPEPEPSELRLAWNGTAWSMPDVLGRPLREVLVGFQGAGLELDLDGTGVAVAQVPDPGTPVALGSTVSIVLR